MMICGFEQKSHSHTLALQELLDLAFQRIVRVQVGEPVPGSLVLTGQSLPSHPGRAAFQSGVGVPVL